MAVVLALVAYVALPAALVSIGMELEGVSGWVVCLERTL